MKKNDGILLGQPGELMEMLFFNTYQGTINIKALTHHLFYILDGSLALLYQAKKYLLSTNDIFFIPLEEVIILSGKECHALTLAIPPSRFSDSKPHIYCNSALFPNPHYDTLRGLFAALLPLLSSVPDRDREKTQKAFRDISLFLTTHFYAKQPPNTSLQPEALPFSPNKHQIFLKDVLHEINTHYSKRITLSSLAKQYYVSTSYLSKLFLKETGLHFNDYVLNLRLSDAMSMVIFSSYPLSEIAGYCGFPDTRSLHDAFSKANGIGPAEYRKRLKKQVDNSEETAQAVKRLTAEGYFRRLFQYLDSSTHTFRMDFHTTSSLTTVTAPLSYSHNLHLAEASTQISPRHFSLLLSDWAFLQREEAQRSLRRLKQEASLEAVAFVLPSSEEAPSLSAFLSAMDFLYQEALTVFLLSPNSPKQKTSLQTESYKTDMILISALNQRYQGKFSFICQDLPYYIKQRFQIFPYSQTSDRFQDSYPFASFLLIQLVRTLSSSIPNIHKQHPFLSYCYTTPSDLCFSSKSYTAFSGKPGLFTINGMAKPAFYAFSFFSRLGSELLYQKDGILVTREREHIQILLYQPSADLEPTLSLPEFYRSATPSRISLRFYDLPYSYAMLTEQRLFSDGTSGLEGWLSLVASANHTDNTLPYELERHLEPVPTLKKSVLPVQEATLLLEYELHPYEICLLELEGGYLAK